MYDATNVAPDTYSVAPHASRVHASLLVTATAPFEDHPLLNNENVARITPSGLTRSTVPGEVTSVPAFWMENVMSVVSAPGPAEATPIE